MRLHIHTLLIVLLIMLCLMFVFDLYFNFGQPLMPNKHVFLFFVLFFPLPLVATYTQIPCTAT